MELDLRDYFQVVKKRFWLVLVVVLTSTIAIGLINYLVIKPTYEASTKLIVNKTADAVNIQQLNTDIINTNLRLIDTYKEIIKTPAIMDLVSQRYPELGLTPEELINKVKVSSVNNTQVMTLAVQDNSYNKAVDIVNAVSEVFQAEIMKIMKVDNVSMLNKAKHSETPVPVKPNKKLNIAVTLVISLMGSIGLIFLLEFLDDTIRTEADVTKILGLPTLSMVTKIKDEDLQAQKSVRNQVGETRHVTINQ